MNWGELKEEIRCLGFEEKEAVEEYIEIVVSATNRAMHIVSSTVLPVISRYDFTQDGTDGLKRYDMVELTKEDGRRKFLSFADTPVMVSNGNYTSFNEFDIEEGHIVVMDGRFPGEFSIFYKKLPTKVTDKTTEDTELDVNERMAPAFPLLVAHYVWLDDDERKSTLYNNQYESLKNELMNDIAKPRGKIRGGF